MYASVLTPAQILAHYEAAFQTAPPPPTGDIPEPATMLCLLAGLGSVGAYIRKRRAA